MTPKRRRLSLVLAGLLALGAAAALALAALEDNLVYFLSPTDLLAREAAPDRPVRVGGLVEEGSVRRAADGTLSFRVTDLRNAVAVTFRGVPPDLFREGQGVVAEGRFANGALSASEILAKHDENYMPREVADALKDSGLWKGPAAR